MRVQRMNRLGFESEVLHNKIPLFVLLGADGFRLSREIHDALDEFAERYDPKMKFIYIDFDHTPDLIYHFDTPTLPVLLTIEEGGEIYERRDYPKSVKDVQEMIDKFFGVHPY